MSQGYIVAIEHQLTVGGASRLLCAVVAVWEQSSFVEAGHNYSSLGTV